MATYRIVEAEMRRDPVLAGYVAALADRARDWSERGPALEALEVRMAQVGTRDRGGLIEKREQELVHDDQDLGFGFVNEVDEDLPLGGRARVVGGELRKRTIKGRRHDAAAGLAESMEAGAARLGYSLADLARPFRPGRQPVAERERRAALAALVREARSTSATLAAVAAVLGTKAQRVHDLERAAG